MKNNKRVLPVQLVISFAAVVGPARMFLSSQVQNLLFLMGYRWTGTVVPNQPHYTDASHLFINSLRWNPRDITYADGGPLRLDEDDGRVVVYDAFQAEQLGEFISQARAAMECHRVIEGVKVTITPFGVRVDPTELMARVSGKAVSIQKTLFGE